MFSVLRISKEKISDKAIKSVEERVTCIRTNSKASIMGLYESMLDGFTHGKRYAFGSWSEEELRDAERLCSKYKSEEWNFSR